MALPVSVVPAGGCRSAARRRGSTDFLRPPRQFFEVLVVAVEVVVRQPVEEDPEKLLVGEELLYHPVVVLKQADGYLHPPPLVHAEKLWPWKELREVVDE